MGINFAYERKKFYEEQKKLRNEYIAARMTEEQIQEIDKFALHQFNRDIAYYRHTVPITNEDDMDYGCEEGRLSIYGKMRMLLLSRCSLLKAQGTGGLMTLRTRGFLTICFPFPSKTWIWWICSFIGD